MAYRMNGQYILEGISGAMMYTLGGAWRCGAAAGANNIHDCEGEGG